MQKDTVLKDDQFSSLVQKVIEMDALIVKGADYAKIVNSSFFQATDVEESINRSAAATGHITFTVSAARRSSIRISGGASVAASGSVGAAVNGKAMKGASPIAGAAGLWLASRRAARRHL